MANTTIYIEGWIEYRLDDEQAHLDAASIKNGGRATHQLASDALMVVAEETCKRDLFNAFNAFNARGASVVDADITLSNFPPE